jgi:hypothetical protein
MSLHLPVLALTRETKCQVKWHAKGITIGKKIPRNYVPNGNTPKLTYNPKIGTDFV